jgi:hypothetical protein
MATKTEKVIVVDNIFGERELTGAELEEFLALQEASRQKWAAREAEAEAKAQAKAELLERLGITADEAKLLLA